MEAWCMQEVQPSTFMLVTLQSHLHSFSLDLEWPNTLMFPAIVAQPQVQ